MALENSLFTYNSLFNTSLAAHSFVNKELTQMPCIVINAILCIQQLEEKNRKGPNSDLTQSNYPINPFLLYSYNTIIDNNIVTILKLAPRPAGFKILYKQ